MEIPHCYEHCSHIQEQGAAFISEGKETDQFVEAYHDENATVVAQVQCINFSATTSTNMALFAEHAVVHLTTLPSASPFDHH